MSARVATPARAAALTRILGQIPHFPELRFDARGGRAARLQKAEEAERAANAEADDAIVESAADLTESTKLAGGGLGSAIEYATLRHWLTAE